MKKNLIVLSLLIIFVSCCNWLSMEPTWPDLKFNNNSNLKLMVLINTQYPDTSLKKAIIDRSIKPNDSAYIGTSLSLKNSDDLGYTIFAFNHSYFEDQWNEQVGSPDSFLNQDSVLKKWVYLKSEIDSLGWEIEYP